MKIKTDCESAQEIKKSRFLTYLHRTESEKEAREFLRLIRKVHPDATHHCYAMRIGGIERSNDDGEPAGSAGVPMLEVLKKREMEDILAVVVRYFGGTLLGVGGLIRAYSSSVANALDEAVLVESQSLPLYRLKADLGLAGKVEHFLFQNGIEPENIEYENQATYTFTTDKKINELLSGRFGGQLQAERIGEVLRDVEIGEMI